ncbi:MAG: tyrosine-type recombinase/integrase [Clostridia bacterium]|nr:tyrosine-type recombinase/integrase [Clostridia bacterium]
MADSSYREQIDAQRITQIREIARELPQSCGDFLRAIAVTTGTFTRLAYAIDLRTFFHFLQAERVAFSEKKLIYFSDADLGRVTQNDLTAYIEYLTYYFRNDEDTERPVKALVNHDLAIKRKLCSIRSFYDYLFKNGRIQANVTTLVPLPKIHEKPIIRLNRDEMTKMLLQAETGEAMTSHQQHYQKLTARRDVALLSLFLGTGIRVSECVGINISDVDLEENAFLVTRKGGNQVVLYFPPEVATNLAEYLEERQKITTLPGHEDALFLSMQKRRITQRAVQNLVKKYAAIAAPLKPRISPHKLRSTFATNLYNATGDIYLVADVLGHSSVDTTRKHYADMTDARRRMAADYVHLPGSGEEPESHSESGMTARPEKPVT